ncbi:hypothetical protein CH63R_12559 [Colletotrichum higginsianum IMI 349063]|uniref:DnaJ homologue subfamily C member 28 conserved domain-containing protein n=1 Tax=Colletotrichum higginsianum (strain IMI 349063) TaxID=759273 RepID=A0A1B7XUH7_COLHI|nr:hypothetical protein CH63R_12559 [Colletotrichum higginsianum IMI 349063]OBR03432.1 hypothetical protein CH63R_12559 [Colletotrichum higginsianum IMI 349063]
MATKLARLPFVCGRCLRSSGRIDTRLHPTPRLYSTDRSSEAAEAAEAPPSSKNKDEPQKEKGAMYRRLEEATEEALLTGGRAGRRAVENAGFSEELRNRLLDKVQTAEFRSKYASAFAEASMPSAAGEGTRSMATAQPWAGEESQSDTVLRMLDDARKPLKPEMRGKFQIPAVDLRPRKPSKMHPSQRAANAREKASTYTDLGLKGANGLSEKEREEMRQEFRDRFGEAARAVPNSISGLESLANSRIEDAIARGQFRNIPRGKGVERDMRANNPFIDTTEYIMNNMIKRQEIVPPWIEKQQEVAKTAESFRARMRNDWRRHVARMISSRGGSLEEQMRLAEDYARAEERHNPRKVPTAGTDDDSATAAATTRQQAAETTATETTRPPVQPFRDSEWLATERSYMMLAVENLNSMTRSYNLMAPELAKKPYFSLERELAACYADVAPLVAETIRERATRPAKSMFDSAGPAGSRTVFDRFAGESATAAKVYDSRAPHYGFKEMWRDLWS